MNTFDKFVNNLVNVNSIYGPVLDYDLVNSKFKEAFVKVTLSGFPMKIYITTLKNSILNLQNY